jgi:hypothetical protein
MVHSSRGGPALRVEAPVFCLVRAVAEQSGKPGQLDIQGRHVRRVADRAIQFFRSFWRCCSSSETDLSVKSERNDWHGYLGVWAGKAVTNCTPIVISLKLFSRADCER